MPNKIEEGKQDASFYLRKLSKAGGARYLSVGRILPPDWHAVKIYMACQADGVIILKLIQIK